MSTTKLLHISEVDEFCDGSDHQALKGCDNLHLDNFCLLCGYFMEGPRLYMEIHDEKGWNGDLPQIPNEQSYVCMECMGQFRVINKYPYTDFRKGMTVLLSNFVEEGKK